MAVQDITVLRQQYDLLKDTENRKNKLIEDLLGRWEQLSIEHHQEKLDHARESDFNRIIQQREISLRDELRKLQSSVERNAFILALIDGDGMIFDDRLVSQGEEGGKQAARLLWSAIEEYVQQNVSNIPSDFKIVARVYANLKGLGDVCRRAGLVDRSDKVEDFARGFTGSKQLFDFIDVGMGKDRADDKISEIFKINLYDRHCRHILFGCSHDNGYARLLEDVTDATILDSITLLEGVPFERELTQIKTKYRTTRFTDLFRTSKINIYQQTHDSLARQRINGPQDIPRDHQPKYTESFPCPQTQYQLPLQPAPIARQDTASPAQASTLNASAPSWAVAAMNAPPYVASPPPTPQPAAQTSQEPLRNRQGQRIDPKAQYDQTEVKRIKSYKLCSNHFLRKDCLHDNCVHDHDYKLNKNELAILRYISRLTRCYFGSECDDPNCIYGHVCPNILEGKTCRWGEKCNFWDLHDVKDTTPAKLVKVGK